VAQWMKRAAEQQLAAAQTHLAQCYVKGVGVGMDAARARQLFAEAAAQGDVKAIVGLGCLLRVRSRPVCESVSWELFDGNHPRCVEELSSVCGAASCARTDSVPERK